MLLRLLALVLIFFRPVVVGIATFFSSALFLLAILVQLMTWAGADFSEHHLSAWWLLVGSFAGFLVMWFYDSLVLLVTGDELILLE